MTEQSQRLQSGTIAQYQKKEKLSFPFLVLSVTVNDIFKVLKSCIKILPEHQILEVSDKNPVNIVNAETKIQHFLSLPLIKILN